jgi:NTP pyrophosphatase (non-canonical NTP hydrolase)
MNVYHEVIKHYGEQAQLEKTLEELKELRLEVRRALEGRCDRDALISKIADVHNMLRQLSIIYHINGYDILFKMDEKMNRTMLRIEKEREGFEETRT